MFADNIEQNCARTGIRFSHFDLAKLGLERLHQNADIFQAVDLAGMELHAVALLNRQDDLDLLERIPTLHVLCREFGRERKIPAHEDISEDVRESGVDFGLLQLFSPRESQ